MPQGAGVRGPVMRQLLNRDPSIYRPINRFGHTPSLPTIQETPSAPTSSLVNTLNNLGISARTISTPTEPLQPINLANLATPPGDTQTTDIATPPGETQTTNLATPPGDTQTTNLATLPGDTQTTDIATAPGNTQTADLISFDDALLESDSETDTSPFENSLYGQELVTDTKGAAASSHTTIPSDIEVPDEIENNFTLDDLHKYNTTHYRYLMFQATDLALYSPNAISLERSIMKTFIKKECEDVDANKLKPKLIKIIADMNNSTKETAKALLENTLSQVLNKEPWPTLITKINTPKGQSYFNLLTPASQMKADNNEVSLFKYPNDFNGISSRSNTLLHPHAVNLWSTELADDKGQTIFEGIRHGVLASSDIESPEEKERVQKEKVMEVFTSAFFLKYKTEIEEYIQKKKTDPTTRIPEFDLKITSTSLMTLKNIKIGSLVNEREETLNTDQINALKEGSDNIKSIDIAGHSFPVNIDICSFSAPVNELAIGRFTLLNHSGWPKTKALNQEAFKTFFGEDGIDGAEEKAGWVQKAIIKLRNAEGTQEEKDKNNIKINKIEVLAREIKRINYLNLDKKLDADLFKLSKRLVLLTHLIDATPLFNCKSGKDRTAALDSEVKALAAQMHQQTQSGSKAETSVTLENLQAFYTDPANGRIQQLNYSIAGNKCSNYANPYFKKIMTKEQFRLFKGNCNDA